MNLSVKDRSYLKVEEALFHFALIGDHLLVTNTCWDAELIRVFCKQLRPYSEEEAYLNIPMPLKIELGEATNVASTIYMD